MIRKKSELRCSNVRGNWMPLTQPGPHSNMITERKNRVDGDRWGQTVWSKKTKPKQATETIRVLGCRGEDAKCVTERVARPVPVANWQRNRDRLANESAGADWLGIGARTRTRIDPGVTAEYDERVKRTCRNDMWQMPIDPKKRPNGRESTDRSRTLAPYTVAHYWLTRSRFSKRWSLIDESRLHRIPTNRFQRIKFISKSKRLSTRAVNFSKDVGQDVVKATTLAMHKKAPKHGMWSPNVNAKVIVYGNCGNFANCLQLQFFHKMLTMMLSMLIVIACETS